MRVGFPSEGQDATLVADSEFDLGALGRALWQKKWRIIIPALVVALATFVVVNMLTPRYASDAQVLIDTRENVFLRPEAEKTSSDRAMPDEQAITSQVQVFLGRDLARDVVTKLKLGKRPEFDPLLNGVSPVTHILALFGFAKDPLKMTPEERVLQSYYNRLNVFSLEHSRVIQATFQSSDPELAAKVANAIADGYLVLQQQAKQDQARSASQWLSGEIDGLRKKVTEAEAKAAEYRAQSNLFVNPNNVSLANQQLTELNSQLATARAQKADGEARSRLIRGILKSGRAVEAGDVIDSESIRRLSEQRAMFAAQLAEQSASLMDRHPRIRELRAQIADLDREIRREAERRVRALEHTAQIAGSRVESLTASLNQLKGQAASSNALDVQMRALEREAKSQRDLLESYLAKYREAVARESINAAPADARIISRAIVSNVPVFPKRVPMIMVATTLTLMLGMGWVVTRELLRPQNFHSIGRGSGLLPSAPVPLTTPHRGVRMLEADPAQPVPMGVVENLAHALRAAGEAGHRVAVFGASHGIGTSFAATALARALARDSRVVLVDLALDAPNLALMSDDPNAPGIGELVAGTASVADVIVKDQMSAAHLIAAGQHAQAPAAVLSSSFLAMAMEALARSYDHVIIDGGAVPESDGARFAQLAQTGVLVVANPAHRQALVARQRLFAMGFTDVTMLVVVGGASS